MMDTSYLEQQVATIIGKLHELFDEIGVPSHERDTRESEVRTGCNAATRREKKLTEAQTAVLGSLRDAAQPAAACSKVRGSSRADSTDADI